MHSGRTSWLWLACARTSLCICTLIGLALSALGAEAANTRLQGRVQSAGTALAGYEVSLYASFVDHGPPWKLLGTDTSDGAGNFEITYTLPHGLSDGQSILFVQAERGPVMLASAIGTGSSAPDYVVVNERTTVA